MRASTPSARYLEYLQKLTYMDSSVKLVPPPVTVLEACETLPKDGIAAFVAIVAWAESPWRNPGSFQHRARRGYGSSMTDLNR